MVNLGPQKAVSSGSWGSPENWQCHIPAGGNPEAKLTHREALGAGVFLGLQAWRNRSVMYPPHTPVPNLQQAWPPSRLRDMVYHEERLPKKGASAEEGAGLLGLCLGPPCLYRNSGSPSPGSLWVGACGHEPAGRGEG